MKLYVDTNAKQVMVTREPEAELDDKGHQKSERDTVRLLWRTQVFIQDKEGGEVIVVTTAGERPNVKVGQPATPSKLEAAGVGLIVSGRRRVDENRTGRYGDVPVEPEMLSVDRPDCWALALAQIADARCRRAGVL
ncbi:MAG: hypothetical protein JWN00_1427 [Actinomycetia bacterium]|nr:hypothetical protein [Actinomycetes bacterium]